MFLISTMNVKNKDVIFWFLATFLACLWQSAVCQVSHVTRVPQTATFIGVEHWCSDRMLAKWGNWLLLSVEQLIFFFFPYFTFQPSSVIIMQPLVRIYFFLNVHIITVVLCLCFSFMNSLFCCLSPVITLYDICVIFSLQTFSSLGGQTCAFWGTEIIWAALCWLV